jgi:hypothetical protein
MSSAFLSSVLAEYAKGVKNDMTIDPRMRLGIGADGRVLRTPRRSCLEGKFHLCQKVVYDLVTFDLKRTQQFTKRHKCINIVGPLSTRIWI